MRFFKNKSRVVAVVAVAALLAAGWLAFKPDHSVSTPGGPKAAGASTSQSTTADSSSGSSAYVDTADFKYQIPSGWVPIKQEALDQAAATSGIARVSSLSATFKTSIDSTTPKNDNSTLDIIRKNAPNFVLLSSSDVKVDSHAGRQFNYTFTSSDGKDKFHHQLNVIPYKGRTFFLLFSAIDSDFGKQTSEFSKILTSFKFK